MRIYKNNLKGVLPVIQTPFQENWAIDAPTLEREINWLFEEGVDGIVIGMVSEILRLTESERDELTRLCVKFTAGRGPVVASVGAEGTRQAIRNARAAADVGVDALMATPPSLTRCDSSEIIDYYQNLLEATELPIIVQDASGYVGNTILIETQAAVFALAPARVLFKPEAQPIGMNVSALARATGNAAPIFEGTAGLALMNSYPRGIVGTMPGSDVPWAIVAIWQALQSKNWVRAGDIHARLAALVDHMHCLDAYLAIEKLLLVEQGIFKNLLVRGPVGYQPDEATIREVMRLFRALQEVCGR